MWPALGPRVPTPGPALGSFAVMRPRKGVVGLRIDRADSLSPNDVVGIADDAVS